MSFEKTVNIGLVDKIKKDFDKQTENTFFYKKYSSTLEELKKMNIGEEDIASINDILKTLSSSPSHLQVSKYMGDLESILNKHKGEKKNVVAETGTSLGGEKQRIKKLGKINLDTSVGNKKSDEGILNYTSVDSSSSSEELSKIESISLNTSIDEEDFKQRYNEFLEEFKKSKKFLSLDENEQKLILDNLAKIYKETLKSVSHSKKVSLNSFNVHFDKLGQQVKNTPDGKEVKVVVQGGEEITFSSKKEAFDFLKYYKEEFYYELEDNISMSLNLILELSTSALGVLYNVGSYPFRKTIEEFSDIFSEWSENSAGQNLFQVLWFLTIGFLSANFYETVWRRGIIDKYAKYFLRSDKDSRFTIPDFSKNGDILTSEKADLRNEYFERLNIIQILEEKMSELSGKEKILYKSRLDDVKSFLNVNTTTFKKKAFALEKGVTNIRRSWWVVTDGFFPRRLSDKAGTYFNTNTDRNEKLKKGMQYLYKSPNIDENNGKLKLDTEKLEYSEEIKRIFDYIDSKTDIDQTEKTRRKNYLEKFLDENKNIPKTKEFLQREIYGIAEEGWLSQDEIVSELQKKLKKMDPPRAKNGRSISEWFGEYFKYKKFQIEQTLSKIYGKIIPASFTKGQAEIIWLISEAKNGSLKGVTADSIKNIEKGIEFKSLLNVPGSILGKIYDGRPLVLTEKLPEIQKIDDLENILQKIQDKGESHFKSIKYGEKILTTSEELKALKNIINLGHNFDDGKEIKFEKAIEEIEKKGYTLDKAKKQILLMSKGYLPEHYILEKLESGFLTSEKANLLYKEFKALVETGKWFGNEKKLKEDIKKLKEDIANKNPTLSIKAVNDPIDKILESRSGDTIDTLLDELKEEGRKFGEQNFKNRNFGIPFVDKEVDGKKIKTIDKTDFENNEGKLARILGNFDGEKLNDFLDELDKGLDFRFDEYLNEMKDILGIEFDSDTVKNRKGIFKALGVEIQEKIQEKLENLKNTNLSLENRIKAKKEVEKILYGDGLTYESNGILKLDTDGEKIKNMNSLLEKAGVTEHKTLLNEVENEIRKLEAKANKNNLLKRLDDYKKELSNLSLENFSEKRTEFDNFVSEKLDLSDKDYNQKINEFNNEFEILREEKINLKLESFRRMLSNSTALDKTNNVFNDFERFVTKYGLDDTTTLVKQFRDEYKEKIKSLNPNSQPNQGPDNSSQQKETVDNLTEKHNKAKDLINRLEIELRLRGKYEDLKYLRDRYNNIAYLKSTDLDYLKQNLEKTYGFEIRDISTLVTKLDFDRDIFSVHFNKINFDNQSFDLKDSDSSFRSILKGISDGHIKFKL